MERCWRIFCNGTAGNIADAIPGKLAGVLGNVFSNTSETLAGITSQVNAIPGVGDILNPVMEPMMGQLQAFTQL